MMPEQPMIRTALTSLLSITHPIVSAPMCGMAMGKLAGSVAASGGVGLIGVGSSRIFGPDRIRQEYEIAQQQVKQGHGALGFGFLEGFMDEAAGDEAFDACLKLNPDVVFFSGYTTDTPEIWMKRVREGCSTAKIMVQAFSVKEAVAAAQLGADAVVIQGCDAGGHGRQDAGVSIVSLIPQTRLALAKAGHGDCVLLAAGGIATGSQMGAALVLGADGVLIGSAFAVAQESLAKESFKERIWETADGTSGTSVSNVWDRLSSLGGPFLTGDFVGRALSDSEALKRVFPEKEPTKTDKEWYAKSDYCARAVKSGRASLGNGGRSNPCIERAKPFSDQSVDYIKEPQAGTRITMQLPNFCPLRPAVVKRQDGIGKGKSIKLYIRKYEVA